MKTRLLIAVVALAITGLAQQGPAGQAMSQKAPDFTLPAADGQQFSLAAQRGHKLIISFYRGYY